MLQQQALSSALPELVVDLVSDPKAANAHETSIPTVSAALAAEPMHGRGPTPMMGSEAHRTMETPQPPTDPAARRRNHQLMIAGVLCYPVAGLLLLHALGEPGAPLPWVLLGLWVALAGAANVFAWKRYYKRYPPQPWPGSPQNRG
ncbi:MULTISPECIES: hypothetical protein [Microbacterium]|uniref:hypothetical protein n=2 Tax=Microbacteriaceae TaxID=85023 RepID=UPI002B49718C|nr:hypothetical protein [Microbacterium plantarum]WRK17106.1 hypothetical protein VC184_14530 [Microbacterium plantarum]